MKHFERIQKYLNGEMTEAERQAFLAEMQKDEALAEEVKIQQFEEGALEWMRRENLREKIQHYRSENTTAPQNKRPAFSILKSIKNLNPWLLSAAAVLLLLIGFFFLFPDPLPHPGQLADELSQQYPPEDNILRSAEEYTDTSLEAGLQPLYDYAHQHFKRGNYAEAKIQFEAYILSAPPSFRKVDEMEFYLFLALLKTGKIDEAKILAKRISKDPEHRFQAIAEEALKQLK